MDAQDRERMVRTEEGVRRANDGIDKLHSAFAQHCIMDAEDKAVFAREVGSLQAKSGLLGVISGFLGGIATFFLHGR